jgi:uncharacterized membrane protein YeaQ/YmgE (transglycosylase-associated protein family)
MEVLGWIVLGLVVGALAKLIIPSRAPGGILITLVIGVVGAVLGGFAGMAIFGVGLGEFFTMRTWVMALLGSMVLLGIWLSVAGRGATPRT